jgi:hypothetical protein
MTNLPVDLANQALDAAMYPLSLGDIEDGSDEARIIVRAYRNCLMQLLRAAHWNFARKTAPLLLLADASGNTPNVGTVVPNTWFIYEYAYPDDCAKARFVPWNLSNQASNVPAGNIQIPQTPLVTGLGSTPALGQRIHPARFTVETDFNYPPVAGQATWEVQGVSPQGRTVICTNVRYATLVYTAIMLYPSVWDPLFRAAFVTYLASEIAGPLWSRRNPKFGMEVRKDLIEMVKDKVTQARATDGNEGGPSTSDIAVDWIRTRQVGGMWAGGWTGQGDGPGYMGMGWDSLPLAGGSVF